MTRVLAFLFLLISMDAIGAPALSDEQRAEVAAGRVLVIPAATVDDRGVAARAYGIVPSPPSAVWPVVRDCHLYSQFMPRTVRSEVSERQGDRMRCFTEVEMPFPFSNLSALVQSTNRRTADGGFHRAWELIRGDYHRNSGQWSVYPWGGRGEKSLLVYQVSVDPKVSIPNFIIRKAQTGALPDVFEAIRLRVKKTN